MARVKTVEIEGEKYNLKSLTMDQVEEFWDDPDTSVKGLRARTWKNIEYALNNASNNGVVSIEEIKKKLTLEGYKQLNQAVLEVSYMHEAAPGET